ncbi:MAG: RtcB family protein, partial [Bacteroidota bacterium]
MQRIFQNQDKYRADEIWKPLIQQLDYELHKTKQPLLKKKESPIAIFGQTQIEGAAIHQMEMAMKLPVSKRGALMPDAHLGYGLPIGGVLAVENAVIPWAVG